MLDAVIRWLKRNANDGLYIGYDVGGEPYVDTKLLCRHMKADLEKEIQG